MEGAEGGREGEVGVVGQVEDGESFVEEEGSEVSQKIVGEIELLKERESSQSIEGGQAAAGQV